MLQGTRSDLPPSAVAETPLIVFINARSGGRAGPKLARQLCRAVGRAQVGLCSLQRMEMVVDWVHVDQCLRCMQGLVRSATFRVALKEPNR